MSKSKEMFNAMREAEMTAYDYMMSEEYNRISMQCDSGYNSGMKGMFDQLYGR